MNYIFVSSIRLVFGIPGQRGAGSDGNDGVLRIPQSLSITGASQSDCFVSYPGHALAGKSYPSAVGVFYSASRLDNAIRFQVNFIIYIYILLYILYIYIYIVYIYIIYIYIYQPLHSGRI